MLMAVIVVKLENYVWPSSAFQCRERNGAMQRYFSCFKPVKPVTDRKENLKQSPKPKETRTGERRIGKIFEGL